MRVIYQKHFSFLLSKNLLEGDGCLHLIFPLPSGSTGKELTCQCRRHDRQVRCLGREDCLEKAMATLSSILAWKIPWTEKPGGWQPTESQSWTQLSVQHIHTHTHTHPHTQPRIFLIMKYNRMRLLNIGQQYQCYILILWPMAPHFALKVLSFNFLCHSCWSICL